MAPRTLLWERCGPGRKAGRPGRPVCRPRARLGAPLLRPGGGAEASCICMRRLHCALGAARWRGRQSRGGERRAGRAERMERREPGAAAAKGPARPRGGERAANRCGRRAAGAVGAGGGGGGGVSAGPGPERPALASWSGRPVSRPSPGPLWRRPEAGPGPRVCEAVRPRRRAWRAPGAVRAHPLGEAARDADRPIRRSVGSPLS